MFILFYYVICYMHFSIAKTYSVIIQCRAIMFIILFVGTVIFFNQTKLTNGKHIYLQSNANGMKQSKIFWNVSNEANKIVHYLLGFIDFTWCLALAIFLLFYTIDHEFILHHWKSTTTSTKCLFLLIIITQAIFSVSLFQFMIY